MNLKEIINSFRTTVSEIEHRLTKDERDQFKEIKESLHDLQTTLYLMGIRLKDINQAAEQLKREKPINEEDNQQNREFQT